MSGAYIYSYTAHTQIFSFATERVAGRVYIMQNTRNALCAWINTAKILIKSREEFRICFELVGNSALASSSCSYTDSIRKNYAIEEKQLNEQKKDGE